MWLSIGKYVILPLDTTTCLYSDAITLNSRKCSSLKNAVFCKECNAKILITSNYCPICGKRNSGNTLNAGVIEENSNETLISCRKCNTFNSMNNTFCFKCGERMH